MKSDLSFFMRSIPIVLLVILSIYVLWQGDRALHWPLSAPWATPTSAPDVVYRPSLAPTSAPWPKATATPTTRPIPKPAEPERPWDYFPTQPGTRWAYKITIGEAEPLRCQTVYWPVDNRAIVYVTRGRFLPLLSDNPPKTFDLVLSIKGPAPKQGPLEFPDGVELTIEKDELGIFEEHKQVFWAVRRSARFEVIEVVTYSPDMPGAPTHSWGMPMGKDGFSMRLLFFEEKPGIAIGLGKEPIEELLFTGVDGPYLHFIRQVGAAERKDSEEPTYLDKAFSEEMWFAQGKGLVRLEQRVEGKTAMIWELVEFSKGTD